MEVREVSLGFFRAWGRLCAPIEADFSNGGEPINIARAPDELRSQFRD